MFNWCCSQAVTNRKIYAPWIIFRLLFSFKIFAAAAHLFPDFYKVLLGQPWLGIATNSYSYLQGSKIMRFPFSQFLVQHKEISRYRTGMEAAFAQFNCLVLLFSYVCSLCLPVHWNVCIEVKSNGFGAFMCKYLEVIYSALRWDLLNRFPCFALWKNSSGITCSLLRNVFNAARIPP